MPYPIQEGSHHLAEIFLLLAKIHFYIASLRIFLAALEIYLAKSIFGFSRLKQLFCLNNEISVLLLAKNNALLAEATCPAAIKKDSPAIRRVC
jgi:hypothetical protein